VVRGHGALQVRAALAVFLTFLLVSLAVGREEALISAAAPVLLDTTHQLHAGVSQAAFVAYIAVGVTVSVTALIVAY
jgi:hypothetical protein